MLLAIDIEQIQHIKSMKLSIDLNDNKLTCLVGKNGVGKTTLIKALQNLQFADTFTQTSPASIFSARSTINYSVDAT